MTKRQKAPTMDENSWLFAGHRWIWIPLGIATVVNIVASVVIAVVVK